MSAQQKKISEYEINALPGVSRTFALTIPELPMALAQSVTNAYLLCRIADTIEDDANLSTEKKSLYLEAFLSACKTTAQSFSLAAEVADSLAATTLKEERELVRNSNRVIASLHGFPEQERAAITRCLEDMCSGMPRFQRHQTLNGLKDMSEMNQYCYYVAGCVGDMLTDLFCAYSPEIEANKDCFRELSASFGQGLQMTNILKDQWDDRKREACWLPRDIFLKYDILLSELDSSDSSEGFKQALNELIAVAHGHLNHALEYSLALPKDEAGIRKFCLWAVGMAMLTLQKIADNPFFRSGQEVKISRGTVKRTIFAINMLARSNRGVRALFGWFARRLPKVEVTAKMASELKFQQ